MTAHLPETLRAVSQTEAEIVLRAVSDDAGETAVVETFRRAFGHADLAFILVFATAACSKSRLAAALSDGFEGIPVIGCTTAGEIGGKGYQDNGVIGLGFPSSDFAIRSHRIDRVSQYSITDGAGIVSTLLASGDSGEAAAWSHSFALLLTDGCSRQEDALVSSVAPSLGTIPLIGGSAGDGLSFRETFILHDGAFHEDAALLSLVRTRCELNAFRVDHFSPTARKMVVTSADPEERLVHEINAEPAAREYARMVGKDPEQLSPFIFAENPVVVRVGGEHHVRSIQKVEENGDLRFYCAIDEGLVLTVAEAEDIVEHIDSALFAQSERMEPDLILGFDCVLRRLEVERKQLGRRMSDVLQAHRVYGFSTYGEQFGSKHVNQTFTGLAIYAPATR